MKQLSRKKIQDMIDLSNVGNTRRSSGGSGAGGGGGVSSTWVDDNYVSKEFFSSLFKVYAAGAEEGDPDVEVIPNDTSQTVKSIEALAGLWTESFLSAKGLGSGGGGGGGTILTEPLSTINSSGLGQPVGASQVMCFNGTTWEYATMQQNTGNGTVTSVALTAPTGFAVTGSPITTNGTLALAFDTGYSLPTTESQGHWNTAYTWVNTNGSTSVDHTVWGQPYWVNGAPTNVGSVSSFAAMSYVSNIDSLLYFDTSHSSVGVGTSADHNYRLFVHNNTVSNTSYGIMAEGQNYFTGRTGIGTTPDTSIMLNVGGYTKTTRLYLASDVYFEYNITNHGVQLVGAGFYTNSYISALGTGSGGGSAGYIPLSGSSAITGNLNPNTNRGASLGTNSKMWNNIYGYVINGTSVVGSSVTATSSMFIGNDLVATQSWVSSNYVGLAGSQNISGVKTFLANVNVGVSGNPKSFHLYGTMTLNASSSYSTFALTVGGGSTSKSIWCEGDIYTHGSEVDYSDIRLKNVIENINLSVEDIAGAPSFTFTWKDMNDDIVHAGTSAQYWNGILPQTVGTDYKGYLGVSYGKTGLLSVIAVARKVVEQEKEIASMKAKIKELEERFKAS